MKAIREAVPLYGTTAWVCFDRQGWEDIRRHVKPPKDEMPLEAWSQRPGIAATYDCMFKGEQHVILQLDVEPKSKQPGLPGIIAHEAFHAAMAVSSHVGIHPVAHSDEPTAYLVQWFADLMWQHLPADVEI